MATLRSLDAATNADVIGTDANPTLTLKNTSTGPGLKVDTLVVTGGATIAGPFTPTGVISTTTIVSTATNAPALTLFRSGVVGNSSTALLNLNVSGASVPVLQLQASAFTSAVSLIFAAGSGWAGMGAIRVQFSDNVTSGWIPVLPNAQVTAAVAS